MDAHRLAGSVVQLLQNDDTDGLKAVHDSGKWTDLEMVVHSGKGPDGNTWYFTALAMAAFNNQLGMMRLLIQLRAKVDEERERHFLPL